MNWLKIFQLSLKTGFELVAMRTDPLWCISTEEAKHSRSPGPDNGPHGTNRKKLTNTVIMWLAAAAGWVVVPGF